MQGDYSEHTRSLAARRQENSRSRSRSHSRSSLSNRSSASSSPPRGSSGAAAAAAAARARPSGTALGLMSGSPGSPGSPSPLGSSPGTAARISEEHQALEDRLRSEEAAKREALGRVTEAREVVLAEAQQLQDRLLLDHMELKMQEKKLSAAAGALLRALKTEEKSVNNLSGSVTKVNKQRRQMLARITEPSWSVPHHYHMTAVEHTLGHVQPHVMDVGTMIRGHLRVFAMAHAAARFQQNANHFLTKAKKQRVQVSENIKSVYRALRETRVHIKQLEKLLDALRTHANGSKKVNWGHRQAELVRERQQAEREVRQRAAVAEAQSLAAAAKAQQTSLSDLDTVPDQPPPKSGRLAKRRPPSLLLDLCPMPDKDDGSGGESDGSPSSASDGSQPNSPGEVPHFGPHSRAKTSQPLRPPSPHPRQFGGAGGRGRNNIRMKFFQALNLTPPALQRSAAPTTKSTGKASSRAQGDTSSADPSSPNEPTSEDAGAEDNGGKLPQSTEHRFSEEWKQFEEIVKRLEPLNKAKQAAWEELEVVLDHREKLKHEWNQLHAKVPYRDMGDADQEASD